MSVSAKSDRVAVVTGAGRGIGHEVATALLGAGFRVAALDRSWVATGLSNDRAADARAALEALGALVAEVDVTDEAAIARAYDEVVGAFGSVDVLVNNAAMRMRDVDPRRYVEVLDTTVEQWRRMLDVNVLGPLRMIKRFATPMVEQRSGAIVNVSSSSGSWGRPGDNPYGASKAALTNLSQSLASELSDRGIAVSVVYPGVTWTTGYEEQNALDPAPASAAGLPILRPGSVAPLVLWLVDQGMDVTGQTFSVVDWLVEHGLGPIERWLAPLDSRAEPVAAGEAGTRC